MKPVNPDREPFRRISSLERTAYHEAGHAVVAVLKRRGLCKVSIIPNKKRNLRGHVATRGWRGLFPPGVGNDQRGFIEREGMVLLAGPAAQVMATGRIDRVGCVGDFASFYDLIKPLFGGMDHGLSTLELDKMAEYQIRLNQRVLSLLTDNWPAVLALAEVLLREKTIDGPRARKIVLEARPSSPPAGAALRERPLQGRPLAEYVTL